MEYYTLTTKMRLSQAVKLSFVAIFSFIISILIAEITLRALGYAERTIRVQGHPFHKNFYIPDHQMGFDLPKNMPQRDFFIPDSKITVFTNSLGLFDSPYNGEKDYILVSGDSFTFGYSPNYKKIWGFVLEDILKQRVIKCGVSGYGTKQELLKTKKILTQLSHPPKLFILAHFINDLDDDFLFPREKVVDHHLVNSYHIQTNSNTNKIEVIKRTDSEIRRGIFTREQYNMVTEPSHPQLQKIKVWMGRNSILYALLKQILNAQQIKKDIHNKTATQTTSPYILPFDIYQPGDSSEFSTEVWENHLKNILDFKTLAKEYHAPLLILNIPEKIQVYPFLQDDPQKDYFTPNKKLQSFCQENDILFFDLTPGFIKFSRKNISKLDSEKDLYWANDIHFNPKGNMLAGFLLSEYLLKNQVIPIDNAEEKLRGVAVKLQDLANQSN